jgi:hypothetical protein
LSGQNSGWPPPDAAEDPERAAAMVSAALEWLGDALETDEVGAVRPLEPASARQEATAPPLEDCPVG